MTATERGELIATGRTAEVFGWGDTCVLKLIRPEMPSGLADVEVRAARIVEAARLPAPRLLEVLEVDGRAGLVYERLVGPSMLEVLLREPAAAARLATAFAALQVEMHASPGVGLPETRAGMRRAVEYARDAGILDPGLAERVIERLERLPDGDAVVHGDLHPGNVIMAARGPEVIDWMSVSRGDPLADVARTVFLIRDSNVELPEAVRSALEIIRRQFADAYLDAYAAHRRFDPAALEAWRPVVLAARLAEGIERERPWLLGQLRSLLGA